MEMLNDPYVVMGLFFLCAVLALASLLNAMKSGGSTGGLVLALIFAGVAAYFAPGAFAVLSASPS